MNDTEDAQKQKQASEGCVAVNPGEHLTPAQPATEEQLQQAEQKIEERMSAFERSTLKLTRIGLFVGAVTLVIFAGQLWEMNQSGKQTDKLLSAAKALAGAAGDTATAAGDQVDAANNFADSAEGINGGVAGAVGQLEAAANNAKASIKATQDAMRLDQRAWLGASDYTYSITESGPIESSATVLNTGKTPALNILCKTTGTTRIKDYVLRDSDIVYPPDLPILKQGTLFPNQHFPLKACCGTAMDSGKQKVWFDNVQSVTWIQYFFGEVRYKDAFGKDHWTHFCTQYVPVTKSGTPCPVYNDTDEGDIKRQNPN